MDDFDLDVFDNLENDTAVNILLIFLEEISVECNRLKALALEYAIDDMVVSHQIACEKRRLIKDKLTKLYQAA